MVRHQTQIGSSPDLNPNRNGDITRKFSFSFFSSLLQAIQFNIFPLSFLPGIED
jgi:hypothetical protein